MNILLCGAGGAGKTTLVNQMRERYKVIRELPRIEEVARGVIEKCKITRQDQHDKQKFFDLQKLIIIEQCKLEESYENGFISDRSCVDALAYAWRTTGEEPCESFLNDIPQLRRSLDLYRQSLVVLVCPLSFCEDDGTRYLMSADDCKGYTELCVQLFTKLKIPFFFLRTKHPEERLAVLHKVIKGIQPLSTYHLDYYDDKKKTSDRSGDINFAFYISSPTEVKAVPTITVFEDRTEQSWTKEQRGKTTRFTFQRSSTRDLFLLSFDPVVRPNIVQKLLIRGIRINGEVYNFLGCSSSGLKSRKCFLLRGTAEDCRNAINANGNFESIPSVSKRMTRISLLFSSVWLTKICCPNILEEADIENEKYNFTDGCGALSISLAADITLAIHDFDKNCLPSSYIPSVYQIRYQGCKGVLALDTGLSDRTIKIRPSMKKFVTECHPFIGVCDFSKPYVFGNLNRQYITLLASLGVPREVFLRKQFFHLEMVRNMSNDAESAVTILQWQNKFSLAFNILNLKSSDCDTLPEKFKNTICQIQKDLILQFEKLRILIPKSRNIFGVCDTEGILNYGECYLRLTIDDMPHTIRGQVVVCKNPCYLCGDVRVLTAVDAAIRPELQLLEHLVDCIVFPTRGSRPHSNEIAGSDLDGDMYFVSWDEDLVPPSIKPPYDYPAAVSKPQGLISVHKMIEYFSRQNLTNKQIGKVDTIYKIWADIKGADSNECERLGQIFSRVIDAGKTGEKVSIPEGLKVRRPEDVANKQFVWQEMTEIAQKCKISFEEKIISEPCISSKQLTTDFVVDIVKQPFSNLSEFIKFDFAWRHLQNLLGDDEDVRSEFLLRCVDYINFALFSNEEKALAMEKGISSEILWNALNKSQILQRDQLQEFHMQHSLSPWNLHFRINHNDLDWSLLVRALTSYSGVLLVLQLPDEIKIGIQFHETFFIGEGIDVSPGAIEAFLFSEHFGYPKRYILGGNYQLDLQEDIFQLYRQIKQRTFIWIKSQDLSDVGAEVTKLEVRNSLSVDLSRFDSKIYSEQHHPPLRKTPFSTAEVFVLETPYLDILEGNLLDPIPELSVFEDDEEDDLESTLPDVLHIPQEAMGIDEFLPWLSKLVSSCNSRLATHELQKYVEECIFLMTSDLQQSRLSQTLEVMVLCARLGLNETAMQMCPCFKDAGISINELLHILVTWQSWLYLGKILSRGILKNLINSPLFGDEESESAAYFHHFAILQTLALLEEMDTLKGMLTNPAESPESILNLKIDCHPDAKDIPSEKFDVTLYRTAALPFKSKIRRGQFVIVCRQSDSTNSTCFLGQVLAFREAPLSVSIEVLDPITPEILTKCITSPKKIYWRVSLVGNISTFLRCLDAITKLYKPITPLLPILVQPGGHLLSSPLHKDVPFILPSTILSEHCLPEMSHLNPNQREAVAAALTNQITLIQGPPGTGKTTVACEIVQQAHALGTFSGILVCAETNLAVDNIARKLLSNTNLLLLRLGNEDSIAADIFDISLEGQLQKIAATEARTTSHHDHRGVDYRNTRHVRRVIKAAQVFLTTCSSANDSCLEEDMTFELVVCDEATLTREPTLLCALVHGAKCLVLIGDPNQLGPMPLVEKDSGDHPLSQTAGLDTNLPTLSLLSTTLFHRLHEQDSVPTYFLDIQHRMHPALVAFPSRMFYEGKLKSETNRSIPNFPWPDPTRPLCYLESSPNSETRVGTTFKNEDEADIVFLCIERLLCVDEDVGNQRLTLAPRDIGVVTPYQGQVSCIRDKLRSKFVQVEVSSVDGFQGREKEVIVVSCVRSNANGVLGFTDDRNRINVLLTRAKCGFILIGNRQTLSASDLWRNWLNEAPHLDVKRLNQSDSDSRAKRGRGRGGYSARNQRGRGWNHQRGRGRNNPRN